jgi:hypothetical protein
MQTNQNNGAAHDVIIGFATPCKFFSYDAQALVSVAANHGTHAVSQQLFYNGIRFAFRLREPNRFSPPGVLHNEFAGNALSFVSATSIQNHLIEVRFV